MNLGIRARPGVIIGFNGQWNSVELPEGRFSTRLYRLNAETQFSPYIALVNTIQYDTQSAVLGWQSRFRWILTPGNDLYVVYTHNWLDEPQLDRFSTLDRRLASKVPVYPPLLMSASGGAGKSDVDDHAGPAGRHDR